MAGSFSSLVSKLSVWWAALRQSFRGTESVSSPLPDWNPHQILHHCPAALMVLDARKPDMPLVYVNAAFERLTGFTSASLVGQRLAFLNLSPEIELALTSTIPEPCLAADDQPNPMMGLMKHKNGQLFPVEIESSPVNDANGTVLYIQSVVRDCREPMPYEEALVASEGRLRSLIDSETAFVIRSDMTGKYTYANAAFAAWCGYDAEALPGTPVMESIVPTDHEKTAAVVKECVMKPGKPVQVALTKILRDQSMRETLWEFIAIQDSTGKVNEIQCMGFDVTEQRKLEAALMQSKAHYYAALEASLDAFYMLESVRDEAGEIIDFRIVEVNNRAVQQMNLPRERLIGTLVCEAFPINRTAGFFERYRKVVETRQPLDDEYEVPGKYVAPGWYYHQVVPVGDGVAIINREITDRKQMMEALQMALEGTQAGTWDWNVATGKTVFNARWAEIIGYTLEELAPVSIQTWVDYAHPEDLVRSNEQLERCFTRQVDFYECEVRMKHKDGHWVWVHDRGMVTAWDVQGKPLRMFGTHLDISERKQMEDALRESEAKYRLIAENTSDGILIVEGLTGPVSYASPTYDAGYGLTPGETIGMSKEEIATLIHPEDRDVLYNHIVAAIARQEKSLTYTYRAKLKDGSYRWREDHTRFQYDSAENYQRAYVSSRDITERVQAQERALQYTMEKERVSMLTQFVQDAAHEFRTPLSVINSKAYLCMRAEDQGARAEHYKQVRDEVKRMARLIDMLMLMTRLEGNEMPTLEQISLPMLIEASIEQCESLQAGTCTLEKEIADDLPEIFGATDHLVEVVKQILDNAVRFNRPQGTVMLKAWADDVQVYIEIHDTGIGISEADMPLIFDTFWRRDEAHSTPGFGLGLAIARRIVRRFGGDITVESTAGEGSCFRILLPASFIPPYFTETETRRQ